MAIGGYPCRYLVLELEDAALRVAYDFNLMTAAATVVRGRVLVGGGELLELVLLGPDRPLRIVQAEQIGGAMFANVGGVARFYSHEHGGWEVRGIDELLEAVDAGRVRLEDYVGPAT